MKKLLICLAAICVSMGAVAQPPLNGAPFVIIQNQIIEVQSDILGLQSQIDDIVSDATDLEDQVALLEDALALLALDVVANADLIDEINDDLDDLNAALLLKQNIVNGICPSGQAMISANTGANDGQIQCAVTGGTVDQAVATAFAFGPPSSKPSATANCPAGGYTATGGGVSWIGGVLSSGPTVGLAGWTGRGSAGSGAGFAVFVVTAVCIR